MGGFAEQRQPYASSGDGEIMFVRMKAMACAAALGLAMAGAARQADAAITYLVNQTIGAGSVVGSITTNGDLGILDQSDITGWNLTLNGDGASYVVTQADSIVTVGGANLTASLSHLFFNFDGAYAFLLFQNGAPGGQQYYCNATDYGICYAGKSVVPQTIWDASSEYDGDAVGNQIIASVTPEPATWAMMLLGFLSMGAALRARRRGALAPV